jgi:hypothetical protein
MLWVKRPAYSSRLRHPPFAFAAFANWAIVLPLVAGEGTRLTSYRRRREVRTHREESCGITVGKCCDAVVIE